MCPQTSLKCAFIRFDLISQLNSQGFCSFQNYDPNLNINSIKNNFVFISGDHRHQQRMHRGSHGNVCRCTSGRRNYRSSSSAKVKKFKTKVKCYSNLKRPAQLHTAEQECPGPLKMLVIRVRI
jgi:hypothetical protein